MFENKYPYTDFHELNLDWMLTTMKDLEAKVDEVLAKYQEFEDLVEVANAYTDEQIAIVKNLINQNTTSLNALKTSLNNEVTRLESLIYSTRDDITTDVDTKYVRLTQMISQQWEDMKDYISSKVIDVKVRNFFTGQLVSIQSMFDYLAGFHLTDAGTYAQCSGNNTYAYYVAKNQSYTNVILSSRTFFNS